MIPTLHTLETLKEQRKIGIYRLHQQLIEEKFSFYESNKTLFLSFFIFMIALLVEKVYYLAVEGNISVTKCVIWTLISNEINIK